MKTSTNGIQLLLSFEGFRSCPYLLGDGVVTIGYGSTAGVTTKTGCITKAQARSRFARELAGYEHALDVAISKYGLRLTQNQYDAFVSFLYNLGTGMLQPSHDFGRWLSKGLVSKAIESMIEYVNPGSKFEAGLRSRRKREMALANQAIPLKLTRDEKLVAAWTARLLRLRADVRKIGRWTPGRQKLAKQLEANIAHHTKK